MGGVPVRQSPHKRCPPVSGLSWFSGLGIGVFAVDLKIAMKFYVYDNEAFDEEPSKPIGAMSHRASVSLGLASSMRVP